MKWNIFYYNINARKIETFNIFNHGRFREDVIRNLTIIENKEEFAQTLKSNLMYYFWAKAEWELLFSPWVGGDQEKDSVKIDVYEQVMNNWEIFLNYVWENKDVQQKIST